MNETVHAPSLLQQSCLRQTRLETAISLHVVTLKLHSAVTTRKSQLFIIEAEITSVMHPHFLEGLWVTTLAVMACFSLVWAHGVFLSPALDIALCSSETVSRAQGIEVVFEKSQESCPSTPCHWIVWNKHRNLLLPKKVHNSR